MRRFSVLQSSFTFVWWSGCFYFLYSRGGRLLLKENYFSLHCQTYSNKIIVGYQEHQFLYKLSHLSKLSFYVISILVSISVLYWDLSDIFDMHFPSEMSIDNNSNVCFFIQFLVPHTFRYLVDPYLANYWSRR